MYKLPSNEQVMHSLALTSTGRIFAWGVNNFGQLGEGTNQQQISPTAHSNFIGPTSGRVDDDLAVEYNQVITFPDPTLAGHTFVGWFMDEALTVQYNLTTMPANNVMLYASFTPAT